jgi:sarcosine oxidase
VVADHSKSGDPELLVQKCIDVAHKYNVPIREMNCKEMRDEYTQFIISNGMRGVFEPSAGMVCPERDIAYALKDAKRMATKNGHVLDIVTGTKVMSISEAQAGNNDDSLVVVETRSFGKDTQRSTTTSRAPKVIITAGAWASQLVPELKPHLKVTRQVQGWVDVSRPSSRSGDAISTMTQSLLQLK